VGGSIPSLEENLCLDEGGSHKNFSSEGRRENFFSCSRKKEGKGALQFFLRLRRKSEAVRIDQPREGGGTNWWGEGHSTENGKKKGVWEGVVPFFMQ